MHREYPLLHTCHPNTRNGLGLPCQRGGEGAEKTIVYTKALAVVRSRALLNNYEDNKAKHNVYAQAFLDNSEKLQQMAEIISSGFENAKANEQTYGSRESGVRFAKQSRDNNGLTSKERARFYKAIDNNERGLLVGDNGVLLIDDSSTDPYISDYTLICWYGDKISPVIKAVYKISGFDYNIYNPDYKLINSIVDCERKGVTYDTIREILRDIPLGGEAVFKRYDRKSRRFNTLTPSNRKNNQHNTQNNQAGANGTRVYGQAQGGISGVQGNKQLSGKKSKDDTIYDIDEDELWSDYEETRALDEIDPETGWTVGEPFLYI